MQQDVLRENKGLTVGQGEICCVEVFSGSAGELIISWALSGASEMTDSELISEMTVPTKQRGNTQ